MVNIKIQGSFSPKMRYHSEIKSLHGIIKPSLGQADFSRGFSTLMKRESWRQTCNLLPKPRHPKPPYLNNIFTLLILIAFHNVINLCRPNLFL